MGPLKDVHLLVQEQFHLVQGHALSNPAGLAAEQPMADVFGEDDVFAAGVWKPGLDIICDFEEVPRRFGILRIIIAGCRIHERDQATDGGLLVFGEFADRCLVAAAALGPLIGQCGDRQPLARLDLHFHRLHAVEIGRVVDDRRVAGGQVGEGDIGGGADKRWG